MSTEGINKNWELELVEKYPKIFKDYGADVSVSNMCFGMECRSGWGTLIDVLCQKIQHRIDSITIVYPAWSDDEKALQVVASQIKEKFGGLRFYYSGGDDTIGGMVQMAESLSYKICERCGDGGKTISSNGWYSTRCKRCILDELTEQAQELDMGYEI